MLNLTSTSRSLLIAVAGGGFEIESLINGCVPSEQLESVAAGVAQKLATLGGPSKGPAASGESRDVSARLGHIKGQLNAAWEQTMWQTFREEAALLNLPAGDVPNGGPPARQ